MNKLPSANLKNADHAQAFFVAFMPAGMDFEEVKNPHFWNFVSKKLGEFDIIRVVAEDKSYYGEVMVLSCSAQMAKVCVIRDKKMLDGSEESDIDDGYVVKFRGRYSGWSVLKKEDKSVVFEKGQTRGEAEQWLSNHLKTLS